MDMQERRREGKVPETDKKAAAQYAFVVVV
jgi:hypothetical protein